MVLVQINMWSPEEIVRLHELWNDKVNWYPTREIADMLGRKRNSVISKINQMRFKEGEERWPMRQEATHHNIRHKRADMPRLVEPYTPIVPSVLDTENPQTEEDWDEWAKQKLEKKALLPHPNRQCKWLDDGQQCIETSVRGSYCKEHAEKVYMPRVRA